MLVPAAEPKAVVWVEAPASFIRVGLVPDIETEVPGGVRADLTSEATGANLLRIFGDDRSLLVGGVAHALEGDLCFFCAWRGICVKKGTCFRSSKKIWEQISGRVRRGTYRPRWFR